MILLLSSIFTLDFCGITHGYVKSDHLLFRQDSVPFRGSSLDLWRSKAVHLNETWYEYMTEPMAILQPQSAKCHFKRVTGKWEMTFEVKRWDSEEIQVVENWLTTSVAFRAEKDGLFPIPLTTIQMVWRPEAKTIWDDNKCQLDDTWSGKIHFQRLLFFRFVCNEMIECKQLEVNMKLESNKFQHLYMKYVLFRHVWQDAVKIFSLTINSQFITVGRLYKKLSKMESNTTIRYITERDWMTLQNQSISIIMNVLAEQSANEVDTTFLQREDGEKVRRSIHETLEANETSTDLFDAGDWNLLFWDSEKARPDRAAKQLNDQSIWLGNDTHDEMGNETTFGIANETQHHFPLHLTVSASFALNNFTSTTFLNPSSEKIEKIAMLLAEYHSLEWRQDRFAPKPIKVIRVKLAPPPSPVTINNVHIIGKRIKKRSLIILPDTNKAVRFTQRLMKTGFDIINFKLNDLASKMAQLWDVNTGERAVRNKFV